MPASALPISTRTVIEASGEARRSLHVFCPMYERTVQIETCVDCSACNSLDADGSSSTRPAVRCSFPSRAPRPGSRPVGTVLARFSSALRVDALSSAFALQPSGRPMAVVDASDKLVGLLEPDGHVRVDGGARALAILEHDSVAVALTQLARQRRRYAPVVSNGGTVVGGVDDLDALRALRGIREP